MKLLKFENANNSGPKAYLVSRQLNILVTKYDKNLVYSRLQNWKDGDELKFSVQGRDMINIHLNNLILTYSRSLLLKVWSDVYE